MPEIIPLRVWYPAMHEKWQARLEELARQGVKVFYPLSDRDGWTVHHSVGGAERDPQGYARQVADQHWASWRRPGGYNYLVGTDGRLREMCGLVRMGAHAGDNDWNRRTLGLCFQGDFSNTPPADRMLEAGAEFIASVPIPATQWTHRQVRPKPTSCPGDALARLLPLEAEMKIPKPSWLPWSIIDRLVQRDYLTARPTEETEDMWRTLVFLERADRSIISRMEAWVRDHVKTSIAAAIAVGAGGAQIDYQQLVQEIGRALSGG